MQRKSFLKLAIRASWSYHILAQTSFQPAPKTFWWAELISLAVIWIPQKNFTCPSGKLRTEFTGPIAKSITGSPSSKYEHRRASTLLHNIQNIRICMGKKPIVSVTYENERISIKKLLTSLKMCVTSLLCGPRVDLWPFYGFLCKWLQRIYGRFPSVDQSSRFAGVPNLGKPLYREKTVYINTHKTATNWPVDHTGEK